MKSSKMIGVDLFAGAGGMSLGAELAGVEVACAVEKDIYAAETYRINHINTRVENADICNIDKLPNDVSDYFDILFGGAPCQGFSTSNRRTNNRKNPQNWLYKEFMRILCLYKPRWFVFENVTGLLELESGCFFRDILMEFEQLGYTCSYEVLNAADFGVPQRRSRLFIVGSGEGKKIKLKPTKICPMVSVKDAIEDLPLLDNGASVDVQSYSQQPMSEYAKTMRGDMSECTGNLVSKNSKIVLERYQYIGQGQNWSAIPKELMNDYKDSSQCHTGIYYRLLEEQPSVVIGNYRKSMLIHPRYNRGLSVREAARLQSFPDRYIFKGSIGYQQQQVGNAVPPLLAKHVFEQIVKNIEEKENDIL